MTLIEHPTLSASGNGSELTPTRTQVQVAQRREIRPVEDHSIVANLMDTARFEHLQRVAQLMASSSLLPEHLGMTGRKDDRVELPPATKAANCFRIVNQALRWGMDPFAIIDETYVVGGKLAYQGKLVAAVVNARAGLSKRLRYEFSGAGQDLMVTVLGSFEGEDEPRTATLKLSDARTDNQMWRKDPEQKLIYSGVVKWARRHCPEVVLGVLTDDDLERMQGGDTSAPPASSKLEGLNQRLQVTKRPVSEGQTFVPEPTAVEEALKLGEGPGGSGLPSTSGPESQQAAVADPPTTPETATTTRTTATSPSSPAASAPAVDLPDLDDQLADMVPDEFLKVLREKAKDAGMASKQTFEGAMFKYAKEICGVGDAKKIPVENRPALYRAVVAGKFDFQTGRITE